ncbi:MAG: type VI-D CRISPR-associated RNA-guided ribonuclease Cas13d [Planctomycetaceae bacterium]|jgi:hypothetical protein|nr:type VI-D CRISPR-associated RNA-guided ribonuclease Cas13d [Planctomycetaceae bacterium]
MSNNNDQKKTKAKRLGIKSVLIHGDNRLAITTFGKGNAAEIALSTDTKGDEIKDKLPTKVGGGQVHKIAPVIDVKGKDYQGNALEALLNNPAEHAGEDYLKLKPLLEKEFFGKEFPNDSIRIQIIHNILDIQKILGLYINDIIYVIDNLQGDDQDESKLANILGESLSTGKVKDYLKRINDYLGFFDSAFDFTKKKSEHKTTEAEESKMQKHNIGVLRLLGAVRLCTAHFKNSTFLFAPLDGLDKTLKDEFSDEYKSEFTTEWAIIEQNYSKKINNINNSFLTNAKKNLHIIFDTLKVNDEKLRKDIAKQYYEFSILKKGKNLGINVRRLRELIFELEPFKEEIKNKKHDSYRQKINTVIDFLLYRKFYESAELNEIVSQLRGTPDDDAKKKIYNFFSRFAASVVPPFISNILPRMMDYVKNDDKTKDRNENKNKHEFALNESWFTEVQIKPEDATPLTKLFSFLCNFWSGKEINEILTAYIHKFENIQMFIDLINKEGEEIIFNSQYSLFNENNNQRAGQIAQELRIIASIGKMKDDINPAKFYESAVEILGFSKEMTKDYIKSEILNNHPFRNFISNNVINSRRFIYLVRYIKPRTVRLLMKNRSIVQYVLSRIADIPDSMIDSYYQNLPVHKETDKKRKIEALTKYLVEDFSFDTILKNKNGIAENTKNKNGIAENTKNKNGIAENTKNKNGITENTKNNIEIEHLKALTGLYMTVAFVAVKNLVKTNARYYIAFAAFDRDFHLFKEKFKDDTNFKHTIGKYDNRFAITEYFLDQDDKVRYVPDPNLSDAENKKALFKFLDTRAGKWHFTKEWNIKLRGNIDEAKKIHETGLLLNTVRNDTEHLNVLFALPQYVSEFHADNKPMRSYFELYHFILQKWMSRQEWFDKKNKKFVPNPLSLGDLSNILEKFHTPSHDWIKYAYVSLAYNLPRYKNLTIEALFDEDSEAGKNLIEKWKQKEYEKKKNNEKR